MQLLFCGPAYSIPGHEMFYTKLDVSRKLTTPLLEIVSKTKAQTLFTGKVQADFQA